MNPEEYAVMARAAEHHWWYRALRDALACCLTERIALPAQPRVLDAGCGTGENLRLFERLLAPAYLGGFDLSERALELARAKVPAADLYCSDICDPEIRAGELDLITSLDVLYIPGAARALPGLRRLVAALRPGGWLVLHLPAYEWLRSEHDAAVHTTQRFTRGEVAALLAELGLAPEILTYRVTFAFPAMAASRLCRRALGRRASAARSDLTRPPGRASSAVLYRLARVETGLIVRGAALPFGGSVLAVGRKADRANGSRATRGMGA